MGALFINPRFVKDEKGRDPGVFLTKSEFDKLLEELEDLEDIKSYDEAKNRADEEYVPYEQALAEIKQRRPK